MGGITIVAGEEECSELVLAKKMLGQDGDLGGAVSPQIDIIICYTCTCYKQREERREW
jgi:hypothetical protein